jgi:peptide deformylase
MAVLNLITAPNPLLKQISKPVEEFNQELKEFIDNMVETMYFEGGIGLAAVQVGELKQILVMDVDYQLQHNHDHDHNHKCSDYQIINPNPQHFINPKIIESSQEISSFNEGCLSFPGARAQINRPKTIKLEYFDYFGNRHQKLFEGIHATCLQHEIDHLKGIVFIDYVSKIKRDMILKKMQKKHKNNH